MLNGETLSINANNKYGCFVEILEAIQQQLDAMLSYHCKVLVLRFDLHTDEYQSNNALISKFVRKIRKRLKAKYLIKRLGYVWVREIEKAKSQHYHFALMIDGNKVRHPSILIGLIEAIWVRCYQPKPFTPKNCYYLITRSTGKNYGECFERLSYLAKERGKGYRDKTANDYSTSRIRPK